MMNMTRRNNNNDVKVGDTPADTVMGKAAGVGLNVGVLRFTGTFRITLFKHYHHLEDHLPLLICSYSTIVTNT